ncbi:MAG: FCD domain-containing protein [Alphaproteobacteria bacterium]|nr:FCD domain-containing protein [Alphaproteobacteria bacterium]
MTLAEQAYQKVRWDIISGALPPNQPLRLEQLKQRYGVGFSPIREALNRLQSDRLVVNVALKGFTVAPISAADMWDAIESRCLIECDALRRSIEKGDDAWEAQVVAAYHALMLKAKSVSRLPRPLSEAELRALEDRHYAFHRALIIGCQSQWLLDFADKLYVETERYRFPNLRDAAPLPDRDIGNEHQTLMTTVLARDADKATELLRAHYRSTGHILTELMGPLTTA